MRQYLRASRSLVFLVIGLCTLVFAQPSALAANSSKALPQGSGSQTCAQPPQNVDLMTLSDAQLRLYGLPQHNALDNNPAQWSVVLAHAKYHYCTSSPGVNAAAEENSPAAPDVTESFSSSWAGNVATGARGTYRLAEVTFKVPTVSSPHSSNAAFWAGVGGAVSSPFGLVQAGVTVSVSSSGAQTNQAWWEIVGTPANPLPQYFSFAVHTGDTIMAYVDSNLDNDGYNTFFVDDETTGGYGSPTNPPTYFSDSATGECIAEKHTSPPLSDFGTVDLDSCILGTSSTATQGIGDWPHFYYACTSNGTSTGTKLISVGSITNSEDYAVIWRAAS